MAVEEGGDPVAETSKPQGHSKLWYYKILTS